MGLAGGASLARDGGAPGLFLALSRAVCAKLPGSMDGVLPPPGAAGRERADFWNSVSEATEEPAAVCAALFSCTLGYNDRLTQRAVEGALRRLLAREDAVAPVLHGLCAAAARSTGGKQQAALMLRWSAHLAPRVDAASASFDKLARAQSSLLATLATGSARANRRAPLRASEPLRFWR